MFEWLSLMSGTQIATVLIIGCMCTMWTVGAIVKWTTIRKLGHYPPDSYPFPPTEEERRERERRKNVHGPLND